MRNLAETDNVVNAEAMLARADDVANRDTYHGDRGPAIMRCIAEAQVYATLAVVEQLARLVDAQP